MNYRQLISLFIAVAAVIAVYSLVVKTPANKQSATTKDAPINVASEKPDNAFSFDKNQPPLVLARQARQQGAKGNYQHALAIAKFSLTQIKANYGEQHLYTAYVADDIARWLLATGKLDQAAIFAQQAISIAKNSEGDNSNKYASMLNNYATILLAQGQLVSAEQHYNTVLTIYKKQLLSTDHTLAQAHRNLAMTYQEMTKYDAATKQMEAAFSILSPDQHINDNKTLTYGIGLAKSYRQNNQINKASALLNKLSTAANQLTSVNPTSWLKLRLETASLAIFYNDLKRAESILNEAQLKTQQTNNSKDLYSPLDIASLYYQRGFVYVLKGQLVEAEPIYKHSLNLYRQQLSSQHPAIARTLHSLAIVYKNLGFHERSSKYYDQAIKSFRMALGSSSAPEAATQLEYSLLLSKIGKSERAIKKAQQSLSIFQHLGNEWKLQWGYAHSALGTALLSNQQRTKSITAFEKAKTFMTQARGKNAIDLPPVLSQLAEAYIENNQLDKAQQNIDAALTIHENNKANTPFALAQALSIKARLLTHSHGNQSALNIADRYIQIMENRLSNFNGRMQDAAQEEQRQSRHLFEEYLNIAYPVYLKTPENTAEKMLLAAQYPIASGTASAIAKMASRFAKKNNALSGLIKEREILLNQLENQERLSTEHLAGINTNNKKPNLKNVARQLRHVELTLQNQFPDYVQLTNPQPVSLTQIQDALQVQEAAYTHISSNSGSYLFLITKNDIAISKTKLTSEELSTLVSAIRKSVDLAGVNSMDELPPFRINEAHQIYSNLFKPFEKKLTSIKHLIAVFDGGMQNLNPALLLKEKPALKTLAAKDYRNLAYFGNDIASSIAPSLSAFVYLRTYQAKHRKKQTKLLGFGDPDLDSKQIPTRSVNASQLTSTLSLKPNDIRSALSSLPDTSKELQTIASLIGHKNSELFLRENATEAQLKQTDLSPFNLIVFATHGLLTGEFKGLAEPALVMTPPDNATELDNGLLTASEITELSLQADWIILSACNTAGPDGRPGAEGLSGLAKSFFYAGTRTLLVSHWSVSSDATTDITTGTIRHIRHAPAIGVAEALRRATLELITSHRHKIYAHPAFWAPFTVVGEGAFSIL